MRHCGVALIEDGIPTKLFYLNNDKVECKTKFELVGECYKRTYKFIKEILEEINPDVVAMESATGSQSFNSALNFAFEACIFSFLKENTKKLVKISPTKSKAFIGNKNATKKDVIEWCTQNYPNLNYMRKNGRILNCNEHVCDATIIALSCVVE